MRDAMGALEGIIVILAFVAFDLILTSLAKVLGKINKKLS